MRLAKTFAISPEKGAETIVYLASSPDVAGVSGEYFYKCRPATPTTKPAMTRRRAPLDRVREIRGIDA